jgi:hypothetical protein
MGKAMQRWPKEQPLRAILLVVIVAAVGTIGYRCIARTEMPEAESQVVVPDGVEMIFWEDQSWKHNGRRSRLSLWKDGRSEIVLTGFESGKLKPGWEIAQYSSFQVRRRNPLSKEKAMERFHTALAAGIHELKTFMPGYSDGAGTLVGVEINGKLTEITIPAFVQPGKYEQGSLNERRYLAVKKLMGDFERDPVQP